MPNPTIENSGVVAPADPEGIFQAKGAHDSCNEAALLTRLNDSDHVEKIFFDGDTFRPHRLEQKTFVDVWFKRTLIEDARFFDCKFLDCRLMGVVFRNCEFHDCVFEHCNTHKIRFEKTYVNPKSFRRLPSKSSYANIGVHLFQELYRNSHETLQPEFKNSAEYEFKKWTRYEVFWKWREKKATTFRTAQKWVPNMFFYLLSGYGLKWGRLVFWSALFFAAIVKFNYNHWSKFDFHSSTLIVARRSFHLAVYYTTVTLSTLGYGDITPKSEFGLLVTSVEAMLGLVWLAGVASVFIKKVLR